MTVTAADATRLVMAGFSIVVLHALDTRGNCDCLARSTCPSPGKHPDHAYCPNGKDSAIADPGRAAAIYSERNLNVGIALEPSGLVVVDVDVHPGKPNGHLELAALERKLGALPVTVEDESGGGGRHLYFRRPPGELRKLLAPGVELLTSGLVVVAPSRHASGRTYRWLRDPWQHDVAELPPRWVRQATRGSGTHGFHSSDAVAIDSIPSSVEVTDDELLRLLDDPGPGGDVSRGDFAVARRAARLNYPDRAIAALVVDHRQRCGDPKGKSGRADYIIATVANAKAGKRDRVGVA